jgi:hypothetical protein
VSGARTPDTTRRDAARGETMEICAASFIVAFLIGLYAIPHLLVANELLNSILRLARLPKDKR